MTLPTHSTLDELNARCFHAWATQGHLFTQAAADFHNTLAGMRKTVRASFEISAAIAARFEQLS